MKSICHNLLFSFLILLFVVSCERVDIKDLSYEEIKTLNDEIVQYLPGGAIHITVSQEVNKGKGIKIYLNNGLRQLYSKKQTLTYKGLSGGNILFSFTYISMQGNNLLRLPYETILDSFILNEQGKVESIVFAVNSNNYNNKSFVRYIRLYHNGEIHMVRGDNRDNTSPSNCGNKATIEEENCLEIFDVLNKYVEESN